MKKFLLGLVIALMMTGSGYSSEKNEENTLTPFLDYCDEEIKTADEFKCTVGGVTKILSLDKLGFPNVDESKESLWSIGMGGIDEICKRAKNKAFFYNYSLEDMYSNSPVDLHKGMNKDERFLRSERYGALISHFSNFYNTFCKD